MKQTILFVFILINCSLFAQSTKDVFDIARTGSVTELEDLYNRNKNIVDTVNPQGYTPLILACYRGNDAVAEYLMKNVKDISYSSGMGTALMAVIYKNNATLAEELIKNKIDINKPDSEGATPLIFATKLGNETMVKLLLKYNADKNLKDKEGKTAFEYAVFSKNQNLINSLKN